MGYSFKQEFPGGFDSNDTLHIIIRANEILKQNLEPKDINNLEKGGELAVWDMIAPTDIQENVSHSWEEYSAFQGRAAQLRADIMTSAGKLIQGADGITRKSGNTEPARIKVDSPMVYSGSERLEYSFTFLLMQYRHIKKDVMNPIHEFRKLSCASIEGQTIDTIQFPAVFSITTSPSTFIKVDNAALTNVQVLYNAPFKGGLPSRAELTLTFKDIRPLYTRSFGGVGGIVSTGTI